MDVKEGAVTANTQTHELREKVADCIGGGSTFTREDRLEMADAILSLFPESGGQAEGWKLVPVEPTKAMTDAWWRTHFADVTVQDISDAAAYKAMLAAAPSVTPHKGGGD